MTTFENQADMSKADNSPSLSQQLHSVVRASVGERVLLRVTNGSVDSYFTLTGLGLPMKVVGRGAQIARGPSGAAADSWAHETASITLGGGDGIDVLIDTQARGRHLPLHHESEPVEQGPAKTAAVLTTTFVLQ